MAKTHYIWDFDNDSYLMEKDGAGATTAVYTNEPVPYGKLISQRRANATSYYHFDVQQSTRQLTDQNQNVTDEYAYSAFGESVASSGTTTNPFRFNGALGSFATSETDEIYVRARDYNRLIARWLSIDPLSFVQGTNQYQFALNNPLLFSDPSGMLCCICTIPAAPPPPAIACPVSYFLLTHPIVWVTSVPGKCAPIAFPPGPPPICGKLPACFPNPCAGIRTWACIGTGTWIPVSFIIGICYP